MRHLLIAGSLIVILASTSSAQPARKAQKQRPSVTTSNEVYVGQRQIGSDPDPSVRFEMLRQDNWRKGRMPRLRWDWWRQFYSRT